jgi:PAS domain S-box-containing protein
MTSDMLEKTAADLLALPDVSMAILNAVPVAILAVGPHGQIKLVNERTQLLTGYDKSELLGEQVELLIPDSIKAAHLDVHRPKYQDDPTERPMGAGMGLRLRRRDGSEIPVQIMLKPLPSPWGVLTLVVVKREP